MRKPDKLADKLENNPDLVPAEWTIMIYMAGDNNLAEDCVNALLALKKIETNDKIHVIVQFDPGDPRVSTRRLVINRSSKTNKIPPLVTNLLGSLDEDRIRLERGAIRFGETNHERVEVPHDEGVFETNTANPETLFDFISWSSQHFPADRYMLILAGHSAGVEAGFLLKDEHPAEAMELEGLKTIFKIMAEKLKIKLEILGMDSCLMSMVEVCLELEGYVNLLVGSQSMTPNPGWPYAAIIEFMKAREGHVEAEELAPEIVRSYISSYVDQAINSGTSTDLAALRMESAKVVAAKVRDLANALITSLEDSTLLCVFKRALVLAHWEAQSFNGELFVDLSDFCDLLVEHLATASTGTEDSGGLAAAIERVKHCCAAVKKAIGEMVLESCFCGIDFQYSNGVSIYFPWSTIFFDYLKLEFALERGANWGNFLRSYINGTRRRPRGNGDANLDTGDLDTAFRVEVDSDVSTRRVEPLSHGPSGLAHSMRNPPRRLAKHTIKGLFHSQKHLEAGHH